MPSCEMEQMENHKGQNDRTGKTHPQGRQTGPLGFFDGIGNRASRPVFLDQHVSGNGVQKDARKKK